LINHKVAQPSISVAIAYFVTSLSFNFLVKEFLKSVDIGEVAGKMVKTHLV